MRGTGAALAALEARVDELFALPQGSDVPADAARVVSELLDALESGAVRSATLDGGGAWHAVAWVKRGILAAFRFGKLADLSPGDHTFSFVAKDTIPPPCCIRLTVAGPPTTANTLESSTALCIRSTTPTS